MPVIEKTEGFTLHEEDVFLPAIIHRIDEDEGQFGPQFKFIIAVEGDDEDNEVWAYTSATYSNGSKLGIWTAAILGSMPESLDTDDLVDVPVQVMFEQYDRTNTKSGLKETREKVVKIRAFRA